MRGGLLGAAVVVAALAPLGCDSKTIDCQANTDCIQGGIPGTCLPSTASSTMWCAFPDGSCAGGSRWGVRSGDGLAGSCVESGLDGGVPSTVAVSFQGHGAGHVTSEPSGIDCVDDCSASFPHGATVKLSATSSAASSVFLGWSGECSGTTPCTIAVDSDKQVGATFGIRGDNLWLEQIAATGGNSGRAVTIDGSGDVVMAATVEGDVTIYGSSFPSRGRVDVLVVKLSRADGHSIWVKRLGGPNTDVPWAVATDSVGNVLVAGEFQETANFGGGMITSAGIADVFVVKLNGATGEHMWSERFGGDGFDRPAGIATDSARDVVITGSFNTTIDFGGDTFTTSNGFPDFFIAKLSGADGGHLWSRAAGSTGPDIGKSVAVDHSGNVVVVGEFERTVNLGGSPLTSAGTDNLFVAKYGGSTGQHLFSQRFGSTSAIAYNVAIDSADSIVLAGSFDGPIDFGGAAPLTNVSGSDLFVAKLSLAGSHLWSRSFAATQAQFPGGVAVDSSNNVVMVGDFAGTISFGGQILSSAGDLSNQDIFIARLAASSGDHLSSMRLGGTGNEIVGGVTVGKLGEIYTTGQFSGFAEFGGVPLTSTGASDGFVLATTPP